MAVGANLQPQVQTVFGGTPDGKGAASEFFLRRARIYASGQVSKWATFIVQTDVPNFGKAGQFNQQFILQDLVISLVPTTNLWVDAGLLLLPSSHHGMTSGHALDMLDYRSSTVLYQAGSQLVWRDPGVQLRGVFADGLIQARVGAYSGIRATAAVAEVRDANGVITTAARPALNPGSVPRVAGNARVNILGRENSLYYQGIYFSTTPIVTAGVSANYQPKSTLVGADAADYLALSADVFAEYPFSADMELLFEGAAYRYDFGAGVANTGLGFFAKAGFRFGVVEPLVSYEFYNSDKIGDATGVAHTRGFTGGLNFWINKHATNVKVEYSVLHNVAAAPFSKPSKQALTLQTQLFF